MMIGSTTPLLAALGLFLVSAPVHAQQSVVFTADTTIACGSTTYSGYDVTVDGTAGTVVVTIDCAHSFRSLTLLGDAVVTHSPLQGMDLTIAQDLRIDPQAMIDVRGKGHDWLLGSPGPGAGQVVVGSGGGGASHGGSGAVYSSSTGWIASGVVYGDHAAPTTFGSAGGSVPPAVGGRGGGAVRLRVGGRTILNGRILADGEYATGSVGGGAGGSVWLTTVDWTGFGSILARGVGSQNSFARSGGGRIAIEFVNDRFLGMVLACGGTYGGGAGSVFRKQSGSGRAGDLTYDNCGVASTVPTEIPAPLAVGSLRLVGGASLGHPVGGPALRITVDDDLTVETSATIDVSGRGHTSTSGSVANGSTTGGAGAGGSHGGRGAHSLGGAPAGRTHGAYDEPVEFGGAGGNAQTNAGASGGGAVRLVVGGTLRVDGEVRANGLNASGTSAGSGAGGSLWATVGTLAGVGSFVANGGYAPYSGGGGGGRIALEYDVDSFSGVTLAGPNTGSAFVGNAGTVFRRVQGAPRGSVTIDNLGYRPTGGLTEIDTPFVVEDFVLRNFAALTHTASGGPLQIDATGDVRIEQTARIDVSGRGFAAAFGPGAGESPALGQGPGAGGGGHGGPGETAYFGAGGGSATIAGGQGGSTYDLVTDPTEKGSGGGDYQGRGGAGGGVVRIVAGGTVTLDGAILANGEDAPTGKGGGGAGGSISVRAGTRVLGIGELRAEGGVKQPFGGGSGGGGRIAIRAPSAATFVGTASVARPGTTSAPGTVYVSGAEAHVLEVRNLIGNAIATLEVYGARPGSIQFVLLSTTGDGATPIPSLGLTLGILDPMLFVNGPANGNGRASWTLPIPGFARGIELWFQAIGDDRAGTLGVTNAVAAVVQ